MKVLHSGFFFIDRKFIYPRLPKTTFLKINPREFSEFLADFLIFVDFSKIFTLVYRVYFFLLQNYNFSSSYIIGTYQGLPRNLKIYISRDSLRTTQNNFFQIQFSEFIPEKLNFRRFFDFSNKNYFEYLFND